MQKLLLLRWTLTSLTLMPETFEFRTAMVMFRVCMWLFRLWVRGPLV